MSRPLQHEGFIYKIVCAGSGKAYYGQLSAAPRSNTPRGRRKVVDWKWQIYKSQLRTGIFPNPEFLRDWRKYGEDAFTFHLLHDNIWDEETLHELEDAHICSSPEPVYNIKRGGGGTRRGVGNKTNDKEIIAAVERLDNLSKAAAELGITIERVQAALVRQDISSCKMERKDWDAIVAEYKRGINAYHVGIKHKLSEGQVNMGLAQRGVALRPTGRGKPLAGYVPKKSNKLGLIRNVPPEISREILAEKLKKR